MMNRRGHRWMVPGAEKLTVIAAEFKYFMKSKSIRPDLGKRLDVTRWGGKLTDGGKSQGRYA